MTNQQPRRERQQQPETPQVDETVTAYYATDSFGESLFRGIANLILAWGVFWLFLWSFEQTLNYAVFVTNGNAQDAAAFILSWESNFFPDLNTVSNQALGLALAITLLPVTLLFRAGDRRTSYIANKFYVGLALAFSLFGVFTNIVGFDVFGQTLVADEQTGWVVAAFNMSKPFLAVIAEFSDEFFLLVMVSAKDYMYDAVLQWRGKPPAPFRGVSGNPISSAFVQFFGNRDSGND